MRYNHFKNADADISALTVGTWGIAGANSAGVTWGNVDTEESIAAIRQIIDNGVNMVDTAPINFYSFFNPMFFYIVCNFYTGNIAFITV